MIEAVCVSASEWYPQNFMVCLKLVICIRGGWVGQAVSGAHKGLWCVYNVLFVLEGGWVGQTVGDTHTMWWYVYNLSFVSESARVGQAALSDTHEVWNLFL